RRLRPARTAVESEALREDAGERKARHLPEPDARHQETHAQREQAAEGDRQRRKGYRPGLPVGRPPLDAPAQRPERIVDLRRIELAAIMRHETGYGDRGDQ